MIHDTCDYCFREFGREPGEPAVCVHCGLENIRPAVLAGPETAMKQPANETAVRPPARPRKAKRA